jgi:hypothetical protein
MKNAKIKSCGYCGGCDAVSVDHVVPRAIYPSSKVGSRVQRITVPACVACNNGWSDDEVHFRNVMLVAGDASPTVRELWAGQTRRSFKLADGSRRARDLANQMVPMTVEGRERHMIFPGRDPRVTRIVRKIIRGLSHHLQLLTSVSNEQVWVDVQQFVLPSEFDEAFVEGHVERDVFEYRYCLTPEEEHLHSAWIVRLFSRTPFFGIVYRSVESRREIEGPKTSGC